eukprot:3629781-Prymnesium_polylepis.1
MLRRAAVLASALRARHHGVRPRLPGGTQAPPADDQPIHFSVFGSFSCHGRRSRGRPRQDAASLGH